jgi:5'-3' exonuclease
MIVAALNIPNYAIIKALSNPIYTKIMSEVKDKAILLLATLSAMLMGKNATIRRLTEISASNDAQMAQVAAARDAALASVSGLQAQLDEAITAKMAAMENDRADAATIQQATDDRDAQMASNAAMQVQLSTINATATEAIAAAETAKAEVEAFRAETEADEAALAQAVAESQAVVDANAEA